MNKLKGIVHDFIHVFCISCFCFSYIFIRTPTPIKAEESNSLPYYFSDFYLNVKDGKDSHVTYYITSDKVQNSLKALFQKYPELVNKNSYILHISYYSKNGSIHPKIYLYTSSVSDDIIVDSLYQDTAPHFKNYLDYYSCFLDGSGYYTSYRSRDDNKLSFYYLLNTINGTDNKPFSGIFDFNGFSINFLGNNYYDSFVFNEHTVNNKSITLQQLYDWAMNGTIPDLTPSTGYCTFTWFKDYETVDELLQAIAINPGQQSLNPYVMVSSSKSASSCEEKGTKNLYNTGSFRIVNGIPEFMYTMPPCKDEQIPTADNVFYYGTEVPETGQQQYHAVCTYEGKTVYEYKEGSTGGGLVPDEPDYGIFQPLVDLLNSIFAPITSLLNMFFGNFSTSLETLFKNLFVPSETYFNDKWNGFYSKFNQKFPFISDIKPLADSFIAMATNSNTSRPDFTVTLPEFAGGQTVQIVDLTWFDEYRSMIHAGILFFIYTTFILRLPRKTASAIGGTTS